MTPNDVPSSHCPGASARAGWLQRVGSVLIIVGIAVMSWSFVVWRWDDPFTSLYTRWQQGRLSDRYAVIAEKAVDRNLEDGSDARAKRWLHVRSRRAG